MSYYPPPPPPPEQPGGYPGVPSAYSPYGGGYYQPPRGTNGLAIASLIISCVSFFFCMPASALGAILGHVARNQIKDSGEEGDGLALAGIIVGWIVFGLMAALIAFYVLFFVWAINNQPPSEY